MSAALFLLPLFDPIVLPLRSVTLPLFTGDNKKPIKIPVTKHNAGNRNRPYFAAPSVRMGRINAVPPCLPAFHTTKKQTTYDYNVINGPDWGHSEVVFRYFL